MRSIVVVYCLAMTALVAGCSQTQHAQANDVSTFVRETYPDTSSANPDTVTVGQHFVKTWVLLNSGNVPWHDRYVKRVDPAGDSSVCAELTPIPDTEPEKTCTVSVHMTAPAQPMSHWRVWFKMTDANGTVLLPTEQGIWLDLDVVSRKSTEAKGEIMRPEFKAPLSAQDARHIVVSEGWEYGAEKRIHPSISTHYGIDFPAKWGAPVYADADGWAVASYHTHDMVDAYGRTIGFGLGLFVQIWHPGAKLFTLYAHLSGINPNIPYIPPTFDGRDWQPKAAIFVPVDQFVQQAHQVKQGDLIGYIGYTGLRLGYPETPANPPTVDHSKDKTWDPAGPHLHYEAYSRSPDGSVKQDRYDPTGIYGTTPDYAGLFTRHLRSLVVAANTKRGTAAPAPPLFVTDPKTGIVEFAHP